MREDAAIHSDDQRCDEPYDDTMEPSSGRRCELEEKVTCPVCNAEFAKDVIMQHAKMSGQLARPLSFVWHGVRWSKGRGPAHQDVS